MKLALGASLAAAGAGLVLGIVVSEGRVKSAKNETLRVEAAWEKYRADRMAVGLKLTEKNYQITGEYVATTQENVDDYQMSEMVRVVVHRSDLAAVERLRIDAERRAATYRAQALAGADACRDLADRHAALDQHIVRGTALVAGLRDTVARRDGEVKLLRDQLDAVYVWLEGLNGADED